MKKHSFKEGKFINNDGNFILRFENGWDTSVDEFFEKSVWEITGTLGLFDCEQYENTEYYYIYRKYGKNVTKYTPEEIDASLRKIFSTNFEDVDSEIFSLGIPEKEYENDVFWDVNNDIIIVKGKYYLKQLCIELVMHSYEEWKIKRNPEIDKELVTRMFDAVPMLPKIFELCDSKTAIKK